MQLCVVRSETIRLHFFNAVSSPEFVEGVNSLAAKLQVTQHVNHLITLEAIAKLVKDRYSKEAISKGRHCLQKVFHIDTRLLSLS